MSLRGFHILFIGASMALCVWIAGWGIFQIRHGDPRGRFWAAFAVAALAGLVVYLTRYIRSGRKTA